MCIDSRVASLASGYMYEIVRACMCMLCMPTVLVGNKCTYFVGNKYGIGVIRCESN